MKRRIAAGCLAFAGALGFWLFAVWPPPLWYRSHWPAKTAFMAMRGTPDSTRRYRPVPLDSIAPAMLTAAMIGEDHRFMQHNGVDFEAIRNALGYPRASFSWFSLRDERDMWGALLGAWAHRHDIRGGSTITQQLAKNLYLSPSRNPLRKLKEAVTAYRLEAALGKDRIMELYLNTVELGDQVWGVEAASEDYFGHSARTLSRSEAAALAASLPFPLSSNPEYHPGRMRWRQRMILERMR
ncbi:MAG TPA: biosynthetic peptidoglycan transglycosylase [Gemmatimonadales bacterium]|nr:biosynthetic peptidoglycan transglycosylase [Gemmatimonadales bacterium]